MRPGAADGLRCHGVELSYGEGEGSVRALAGVTLEIPAGGYAALLGRSGSGKTTLLHVLGGLVTPDSGSVHWRDLEVSSLDAAARTAVRARGVAFVFQGSNLFPTMTAWENIAFAMSVAGSEDDPAASLALVGLSGKAGSLPDELSGGERQRVALARAIAQGPEVLLCDEPTGHLDSDTGERILDLVEALRAHLGLTVIIASHDAEVAARADSAHEMADGSLVGSA